MDLIGERIVQPSERVTHGLDSHKAETYRKRGVVSSSLLLFSVSIVY